MPTQPAPPFVAMPPASPVLQRPWPPLRPIDYFGQHADIERLQQALDDEDPGLCAATHIRLAWYLRQRDTRRALQHLSAAGYSPDASVERYTDGHRVLHARAQLVDAEARWLFCEPGSEATALVALNSFQACGDDIGVGDALMLRAQIHYDNADPMVRMQLWEEAAQAYQRAGDDDRGDLVKAWQGYDATYRDAAAIDAAGPTLEGLCRSAHPGVRAVATWALAGIEFEHSRVPASIRGYRASLQLMERCGLLRSSITVMHNVGCAYDTLHDYAAALDWFEQATDMARQTGWPRSESTCLMGVGNVLRLMGRHAASLEFLEQACVKLENVPAGRLQATLERSLGDTLVALGRADEALVRFDRAVALTEELGSTSLLGQTLRGKAQAHSSLGQEAQARDAATRALGIARGLHDRARMIEALCVLAALARTHDWPAPGHSRASSGAIHYLEAAVRLSRGVEGLVMPCESLSDLSRDHEGRGNIAAALRAERQAAVCREATYTREASQAAMVLQVRFEADVARADAEHQRALAASEAQRVTELNVANHLLASIGHIGQSLTRSLSTEALLKVLRKRMAEVLPARCVSVWLLQDGEIAELRTAPAARPRRRRPLQEIEPAIQRCVRELDAEMYSHATLLDGSRGSALIAPLSNGGSVRGALVVEAAALGAYSERDRYVATSLATYVTIGLANALAHQELKRYARTDKLTSLANRRHFDERLAAEVARARRGKRPLSLVLMDVDLFKLYNDSRGHPAGDECLRRVAGCIAAICRQGTDLAARYGGEEFALILGDTGLEDACRMADRVRGEVEALALPHGGSPARVVTLSAGVADLASASDAKRLIDAADAALYRAKHEGRNRWCAASAQAMASIR